VAEEGRTVLFVSHNMAAVQSLCSRAIWLDSGRIMAEGQPARIVSNYIEASVSPSITEQMWEDMATAPGNDQIRLHRVCVRPEDGSSLDPITMETPLAIEAEYWNLVPGARLHITLHLYTEQQIPAFSTGPDSLREPEWGGRPFPVGLFRSVCRIPGNFLNSKLYRVHLLVIQDGQKVIYRHEDILSFDVVELGERYGAYYGEEPGAVRPILQWKTERLNDPWNERLAVQATRA
jgi:lipopolysaccharide transport system ATP-binding protein